MIPVGSTAVREESRWYKPLLGLHGHIHESRGIYKLGRTVCINPGSEYAQGILRGAIVDLRGKETGGLPSCEWIMGGNDQKMEIVKEVED